MTNLIALTRTERKFLTDLSRNPDAVTISDIHCDLAAAWRALDKTGSIVGRRHCKRMIDRLELIKGKLIKGENRE